MRRECLIELVDAVVAVKRPDGSVELDQVFNTTAMGAAGAISGKLRDVGINDAFMREVTASMENGGGALILPIGKVTQEKVLARLQGTGGKIMRRSFDEAKEETLRAGLAGTHAD